MQIRRQRNGLIVWRMSSLDTWKKQRRTHVLRRVCWKRLRISTLNRTKGRQLKKWQIRRCRCRKCSKRYWTKWTTISRRNRRISSKRHQSCPPMNGVAAATTTNQAKMKNGIRPRVAPLISMCSRKLPLVKKKLYRKKHGIMPTQGKKCHGTNSSNQDTRMTLITHWAVTVR